MELTEPYAPRAIRCLEIWQCGEWRIKVYGLAYAGDRPRDDLVASAKDAAARRLPHPAVATQRYGVGFLGVHEGRGSNLMFLDWWERENELHHHVRCSSQTHPTLWGDATPDGMLACVWDLAVIAFEREAWIGQVLAARLPDTERYLANQLNALI